MSKVHKYDFCYLASHGFAARMVLQTNLLVQLSQQGYRISLVVPDKNDENVKTICDENGIDIYECHPDLKFLQKQWITIRKYLFQDIRQNPALYEKFKHDTKSTSSLSKKIRSYSSLLMTIIGQKYPQLRGYFKRKETQWLYSESITSFLQTIDPRILVTTYPMLAPESQLMLSALKLKIPTIIHLLSWDNITSKGIFPAESDYYIAWGSVMQNELEEYYNVDKNDVYICGVPHFDDHFHIHQELDTKIFLSEKIGLNTEIPYLFFTMIAQRYSPTEMELVSKLAHDVSNGEFGPLQLVIRPHPQILKGHTKNDTWLEQLRIIENLPSIFVDYPDLVKRSNIQWSMQQNDMRKLSILLKHCAISLNSGSTTTLEALIFNKPVILTNFDEGAELDYWYSSRRLISYTHLKKLISMGGVDVAQNRNHLNKLIFEYLKNPKKKDKQRKKSIYNECFKMDGKATKRVIDTLIYIHKKEISFSRFN